jgi:uncharacterized oligopeptide transporter (OPT) family protein
MGQTPPSVPSTPTSGAADAAHHDERPLPIAGFQGTPDEVERQWYEQVYKGRGDSMPQLTWRAVLMGSLLGGVLSLTNLYIGLKSGWGFGVAITACILSYAIWSSLCKVFSALTPMTILENNCMQSTASAAGYSTGTTLVSAFAAFILINGHQLPLGLTLAWVFCLAVLGVTMAIPMKRQMINVEQLRFPSGVAAAETLKALHSKGEGGMRAAKALGVAGLLAALSTFLMDGLRLIRPAWEHFQLSALIEKFNLLTVGKTWVGRTIVFAWDPIFIAAGAITGMRVCLSMLISATICWGIYLPILQSTGLTYTFASASFKNDAARLVFGQTLAAGTNDLPTFLWRAMPATARAVLLDTNTLPPAALAGVMADLDRVLSGPLIYTPERFAGVALSPKTQALLASKPVGAELVKLNRELLQDAFPRQLIPHLASTSFKNDAARLTFGKTLAAGTNAIPAYLWSALPAAARSVLLDTNNLPPAALTGVISELDRVLQGPLLYTPERFAGVELSPETEALLAAKPAGTELVKLNRELLDEAFPRQVIPHSSYRAVVQWTLWGGTACMVSSGLLTFLLQWRTSMRAFQNLGKMFKRGGKEDPLDAIEAPTWWFVAAQFVSLFVISILAKKSFDIPYWIAALAMVMSFILALVACRITGETDTTPVGAMGQITQLTVGGLHPGSATTTLMSANIVSSAAISSADLLTDLKSGYLLGAHPRKQFLAQFAGIFTGTIVTVLAFRVLVPDADSISTNQFPAPAAQNWRAVALAMSQGLSVLAPIKRWAIGIGTVVGIVLAVLPLLFPKKVKYLPSAAGVGLAWTFHWYNSFLFFLGAFIGWGFEKWNAKKSEEYTFPVASGVIAGGSLMGVVLIFVENGPAMIKQLMQQFLQ